MKIKKTKKIVTPVLFIYFLITINGYSQCNTDCFIKNIDSAFNDSSNSVEYLICSGNFVGISPIKKPCLLDVKLKSDSLTIGESIHLLNEFNDTINDWSAQVIMEANSRDGGTGSSLIYEKNEHRKWRLQQKWIDLGYWLNSLNLIENNLETNTIQKYDFVVEIEKRINLFNQMNLSINQKILLFQMNEKFTGIKLRYINPRLKIINRKQLVQELNGLFILDKEICDNFENKTITSEISTVLFNYFVNQNKFLYDLDLWDMFYFSIEK